MEINGQLHGNYMLKINTLLRLRLAEELTFNSYFYVNSTNLIYGNSWGIPGNSLYLKHIIAM